MRDFEKIGDYEVASRIGQGSFGIVYRGRDPYLKRDVAIKICSVADQELRERFYREAEIAGRLQHENIVTVFSFGVADGELPYLVQEFLSGEDMDRIIKRQSDISPLQRLEWLRQIACGLVYAHEHGVIHRDIKPGNIRILPGGQIKVMDFGIAKLASAETQLTQKGVTMGSAAYLPPEQIQAEELDHRADIFSFGVLAYELFSYCRPFRGNTLSAVVYQILYKVPPPLSTLWPQCPPALSDLVARCMEKKPELRYASFRALLPELDALHDALARDPVPAVVPAPAAGTAPAGTQPVMVPLDPSPGVTVATQRLAADRVVDDAQPTVRLEDSRSLIDRAHEIANLVHQGDLDQAVQTLETTFQERLERTPVPPPAPAPSIGQRLTRVRAATTAALAPRLAATRRASAAAAGRLGALIAAGWGRARQGFEKPGGARRGVIFGAIGLVTVLAVVLMGWALGQKAPPAPELLSEATNAPPAVVDDVAPRPRPSGTVRVDAVPWGELTEIVDGERVLQPLPAPAATPALFTLPEGRYRIQLRHPDAPEPAECEIEVAPGAVARCDATLAEADAVDYFKTMGWWR